MAGVSARHSDKFVRRCRKRKEVIPLVSMKLRATQRFGDSLSVVWFAGRDRDHLQACGTIILTQGELNCLHNTLVIGEDGASLDYVGCTIVDVHGKELPQ